MPLWGTFSAAASRALIGVPSGASALSTWNPADKSSANCVLSAMDLTATRTGPGGDFQGARSTAFRSTGMLYFEITVNLVVNAFIGSADSALDLLLDFCGNPTNTIGYQSNSGGATLTVDGVTHTMPTYVGTNILRFAYDFTNSKVWASKVGSNWNNSGAADPATNVGGITFDHTNPIAVACSLTALNEGFTLNVGQSAFASAVPLGFTNWG